MKTARPADLAVVIVNYNTGPFLERCLTSLEERAGDASLDVLVIDNASRDGSHRAAVDAHPRVRMIENSSNRFLSPAWNQGIHETAAPYVLLMNPDAEIWSGTLDRLVALMEQRPEVALLGPLIRNADGTPYPTGRRIPTVAEAVGHAFLGPFMPENRFSRAYRMEEWDRASEREVDWVSGACMLLRRAALDEVGLFDERFLLYAEELDISTRLRSAGWSVLFTPEVEVLHEGGVSTGRSRRMHLMHSRSMFLYFDKHRASGWRRALLPFAWLALRLRAEIVSLRDRVAR